MSNELHNDLSNTNPFQVPDSYFESLDKNLLSIMEPVEINVSQKTPFAVPDNYFKQLNNNILNNSKRSNNSSYWWVASAASVVLILGLSLANFTSDNVSYDVKNQVQAKQTDSEVLISYLETEYLDQLETSDLELLVDEPNELYTADFTTDELEMFVEDEYDMEELIDAL